MSVIHNALQSTQTASSAQAENLFNPLNVTPRRPWHWFGYTLTAIMLSLTLGMLLWPKQSESVIAPSKIATETKKATTTPTAQKTETIRTLAPGSDSTSAEVQATKPNQTVTTLATNELQPERIFTKPLTTGTQQPVNTSKKIIDTPTNVALQASDVKVKQTPMADPEVNAAVPTVNTDQKPVLSAPQKSELEESEDAIRLSEQSQSPSGIRDSINQWQQEVETFLTDGEIEKAEATLKTWITLRPDDTQPRLWLARIYINNGVYRAATPLVQNINSIESDALLGVIYERTGRAEQAVQIFENLYRRQPENYRWLLFWAINSENSGQLATAQALYQTYITRFSADDVSLTAFVQQRLQRIKGQ